MDYRVKFSYKGTSCIYLISGLDGIEELYRLVCNIVSHIGYVRKSCIYDTKKQSELLLYLSGCYVNKKGMSLGLGNTRRVHLLSGGAENIRINIADGVVDISPLYKGVKSNEGIILKKSIDISKVSFKDISILESLCYFNIFRSGDTTYKEVRCFSEGA